MSIEAPIPPTAEQLIERLHQELRERSPRTERGPDEIVQDGDEIECDLLTLVDGQLVPGGIQASLRLEMRELPYLPGFINEILGMVAHSAKTIELVLPPSYPIEAYVGRKASIYVEVHRIWAVEAPELDDERALVAAGLGQNIEQAMESVATLIDEEQGNELLETATEAVLETLAERVPFEPSPDQIDLELGKVWDNGPGKSLAPKTQLPDALKRAAREQYIAQVEVRRQERRRQKLGMALAALVEKEQIAPNEETMMALLEPAALMSGLTVEQLKANLKARPKHAEAMTQQALQLAVIEHVMAQAQVEVLD